MVGGEEEESGLVGEGYVVGVHKLLLEKINDDAMGGEETSCGFDKGSNHDPGPGWRQGHQHRSAKLCLCEREIVIDVRFVNTGICRILGVFFLPRKFSGLF